MFQCVHIASGPGTECHLKESGSILFAASLQLCIDTDGIPLSLLFSQVNSPSSFRLLSWKRCSTPFILVALDWTPSVCLHLPCTEEPSTEHSTAGEATLVLSRGERLVTPLAMVSVLCPVKNTDHKRPIVFNKYASNSKTAAHKFDC